MTGGGGCTAVSAEATGSETGDAEVEGVAGSWVLSARQALVTVGSGVSGESTL